MGIKKPSAPTESPKEISQVNYTTDSRDIKLNYYAMAVAIVKECSIETALEKIQSKHPDKVKPQISQDDHQNILKFREEGIPWTEIASYYEAPWTTVYGRVRPRKEKAS